MDRVSNWYCCIFNDSPGVWIRQMTDMKFLFGLGLFIVMVFSFEALLFPEIINKDNPYYSMTFEEKQVYRDWESYDQFVKYGGSFTRRAQDSSLGVLEQFKFQKEHKGEYSPQSVVTDEGLEGKKSILTYMSDIKRILTFDIPESVGMPSFIRPVIVIPIWLCVAFLIIKIISGIIPFVGGVK